MRYLMLLAFALAGCNPVCNTLFSGPDGKERGVVNDVEHYPGTTVVEPAAVAKPQQDVEAVGNAACGYR